jgi:signal transduction histidine kinase
LSRVLSSDVDGVRVFELRIASPFGGRASLPLTAELATVGRLPGNTLSFPHDEAMSRRHLGFERRDGQWFVEDLGSKNGSLVNGALLRQPHCLQLGDTIVAGEVVLTFVQSGREGPGVTFDSSDGHTMLLAESTSLKEILSSGPPEDSSLSSLDGGRRVGALWAFVRAGRELAERRPLPDLFRATLELSLEAVRAERGVLLTLDEGDRLVVQASYGEELRVSRRVRDEVLKQRTSLLIRDDPEESDSDSDRGPSSLIVAPLQTEGRVIGLICLSCIEPRCSFTRDDLSLLTVMANVASIRIERERWDLQRQMLIAENVACLDRMAAALSHELNTPLGTLKSTIDSLVRADARRGSAAPSEQARLEAVRADLKRALDASLERMERVIGHIQRFTNLDRAERQSVDLNELLADVAVLATESSVEIRLVAEDLPSLRCHRPSLSSSFASLIRLASEASRRSAPVEIATHASAGWIEVRIHDNGRPLKPEQVNRLFEPSFQIAEGRISAGDWSLFTARQVIQELGGEIRISSDREKGNTFSVRFASE